MAVWVIDRAGRAGQGLTQSCGGDSVPVMQPEPICDCFRTGLDLATLFPLCLREPEAGRREGPVWLGYFGRLTQVAGTWMAG